MSETKRQVLQMLHNGAITATEAARLLDAMRLRPQVPPAHAPAPVAEAGPAPEVPESHALEAEPALETARSETDAPHAGAPAMSDRLARARELWRFPFGVGLLVMGVAALGMVTNYDNLGYISLTFVGLWGRVCRCGAPGGDRPVGAHRRVDGPGRARAQHRLSPQPAAADPPGGVGVIPGAALHGGALARGRPGSTPARRGGRALA
ncbi:MAG: hypothetical protein M5R40_09860 [Anaerolineae bacterium]|nr:hypothetical protein [Anaerolineae bacterium]